jgi:peptidoglycan hydrolase-like protein with peptidoglycan-binding domain
MLICKNYNLEADSIFGSITDSKVKEFQKNNNLTVDGLVGKNTFEKLFA